MATNIPSHYLKTQDGKDIDPNLYLSKIIENDQEILLMRFQDLSAWFFEIFPNGALEHSFDSRTDIKAVVTAKVYRDINDTRPAAMATCTRYFEENKNGEFFEQNAVTAAYSKAMKYLGFNIPNDGVGYKGMPIISSSEIPERGEEGIILSPVSRPLNIEPSEKNIDAVPVPPKSKPVQKQEEEKMSFEDAAQTILTVGVMSGKTIEEAESVKGQKYIKWLITSCPGLSEKEKKAVKVYAAYKGIQP